MFCMHVCMCTMDMPGSLGSQTRLLDPLEQEFTMVMNHQVGAQEFRMVVNHQVLGTELAPSVRTANALTC